MSQLVLGLAGLAAGAAYLDAKTHLSKDLHQISRAAQGERNFARAVAQGKPSGFFLFEEAAQKYADSTCIWSRQGQYTWSQTYQRVCQYGHYFKSLGVVSSQYVGVYMYNSPDLLFIWLGLLSIGAAPALINYNLASDSLTHCIKISGAKILIYDSAEDCTYRITGVQQQLEDAGLRVIRLSDDVRDSVSAFPRERPSVSCFSKTKKPLPFALMYTSGTTGLPKAFPINVARSYAGASLFPKTFGQQPGPEGDRSYYCIPLYHGTGGIAVMNDLMSGISVAVAPKFSLSRFWQDCIDSQSTIFVYVGELVRYLVSAPPSPNDRKHQIQLIWGNGLSPELWKRVQERFGIMDIGEFYASTEGIMFLLKHYRGGDFGVGAVGHHGWLMRQKLKNMYVPVHIDPETGDIWRSPTTGFARRVPYETGGEVLVKLPSPSGWAGYWQNDGATEKKLARDVFEKGDLYIRTGDSLRRDQDGHWYFMDRLGDTYRWKGENVSTTEVSQVLGSVPGISEANVYGVQVPRSDGRAGCAAVLMEDPEGFDWRSLTSLLRAKLPAYAVPVFIRVRQSRDGMSTDNHKQNKVHLREEGVDYAKLGTKVPGGQNDRLFWLPASANHYEPFAKEDWEMLMHAEDRPRL